MAKNKKDECEEKQPETAAEQQEPAAEETPDELAAKTRE